MTRFENKHIAVALFLPSYTPFSMGGSEIQASKLIKAIQKRGVSAFVVTMATPDLPRLETIDGICVHRFSSIGSRVMGRDAANWKKTYSNQAVVFDYSDKSGNELIYSESGMSAYQVLRIFDQVLTAVQILRKLRESFDILQINVVTSWAVIGAVAGKILGKRVVIKDSTMDGLLQMRMTPFPGMFRRFLCKTCHFVAMTSAIEKNLMKAGVVQSRISRIPNGVEIDKLPERKSSFDYRCLFVGNLYQQPAKGIDILLKAWPGVVRKFPMARLTVVGEGNLQVYMEHVQGCGLGDSISFTGKVDPLRYYRSHDIFVLPSRREGLSNALLEALIHGMFPVATAISGNEDVIEEGCNGFLVPPNDPDLLEMRICQALAEQRSLPPEQRRTMKEKYGMDNIARKYASLYRSILP